MSSTASQSNEQPCSKESKNDGESTATTTTTVSITTTADHGNTMSPPTIRSSSQGNSASQTQGPQYAKVFVQRDYSDGTAVKFMTTFPQGLENKIERSVFEYTINQLNTYFAEAEKASCKTYCEGCFACFTVYTMFLCADTHYEKCLRKVGKFIVEQNEMVYLPRGLLLTNPAERGLRIIEITMLDQPIVART